MRRIRKSRDHHRDCKIAGAKGRWYRRRSAGDRRPYADQCLLCHMRHSRHTYATEMVRAGVSLPALMTLLGHVKAEMTMKYVQVAGDDLQREFLLARSRPRHLVPQPKAPAMSHRAGLDGVADALLFAQHTIEMFRRSLPDGPPRRCLDRLSNRLTKILSEARKLNPAG